MFACRVTNNRWSCFREGQQHLVCAPEDPHVSKKRSESALLDAPMVDETRYGALPVVKCRQGCHSSAFSFGWCQTAYSWCALYLSPPLPVKQPESATGSMADTTSLPAILKDIKIVWVQPESTKPETQILFQGHNVLNIESTGVMNEWAELNFLLFCHISVRLDASQQAKTTLHMRVTFWLNALGHVNTHLIWSLCSVWTISIRSE